MSNQPPRLAELSYELENAHQIHVETIVCDLSETESAENIFTFCQQKNLQLEVLMNNAGILLYGEFVSVAIEKTKIILQLHVNTPVMLCRLFGAEMKKNHKGYILNVSSISAVMPNPTISLYGPT